MPFKIALRSSKKSHYKRYLGELFSLRPPTGSQHEILITSGYFERSTLDENFGARTFLDLIEDQCKTGTITIISSGRGSATPSLRAQLRTRWPQVQQYLDTKHSGNKSWAYEIDAFLGKIYTRVTTPSKIILRSGGYWHAKIAMLIVDGGVIAALVGSSNLTMAAFSETHRFFNNECDVLMWPDIDWMNRHFFGGKIISQTWPGMPQTEELVELPFDDDSGELFGQALGEGTSPAGVVVKHVRTVNDQMQQLHSELLANTRII